MLTPPPVRGQTSPGFICPTNCTTFDRTAQRFCSRYMACLAATTASRSPKMIAGVAADLLARARRPGLHNNQPGRRHGEPDAEPNAQALRELEQGSTSVPSGRLSWPSVLRILRRHHPQPQHAHGLHDGRQPVLCLVRAKPDRPARRHRAAARRYLYRGGRHS